MRVAFEPKMPLPLLVSTVKVPSPQFALIKSTLPSPFTSAAVAQFGLEPTISVALEPKIPLPLLVKTARVPSLLFALIKSTLPSPFTSAAVTETG